MTLSLSLKVNPDVKTLTSVTMDYYIKCAEVIIYRNQYVLRCNKCHNLFLALESFIKHFDANHRHTDGSASPCSKVYIDRTGKNDSFDSYEDDRDKSLIERGANDANATSKLNIKAEKAAPIDANGPLETKPAPQIHTMTPPTNDVPAKFVVSTPQSDYVNANKETKNPCPAGVIVEDGELVFLSSGDSFDPDRDNTDDSTCEKGNKVKTRRITRRFRWEDDERNAIYEYFGDLKTLDKLPTLRQCVDVIRNYPALSKRTAPQVKSWIDNQRRYKLS